MTVVLDQARQAVTAIRTALNYFLAKEIKEEQQQLDRDRDDGGSARP
jgi:hypothetical protein